jgi:DNA-binding transcriptional LysR family regulator
VHDWDGIDELLAIAETGSFVHAAERLRVSTSQVSRALARLEDRLDARLLYRNTRRVSLTQLGHLFVDRCRGVVQERNNIFAELGIGDNVPVRLRMTCPPGYGERFVMPLMARFLGENPRASISVELTNRVVDLIRDGFDLAIRGKLLSDLDSGLIQTKLDSRMLYLCASAGYVEAHGAPQTVDDLAGHQCLLGAADHWSFRIGKRNVSFRPKGRWHCNHGSAVLDAALEGLGICRLPDFYVEEHIAGGALVSLLPEFQPPDEGMWAVYPQRHHVVPVVRRMIDFLRENISRSRGTMRRPVGRAGVRAAKPRHN